MMADKTIDTSLLPEDVRLKLEELEIELAEGKVNYLIGFYCSYSSLFQIEYIDVCFCIMIQMCSFLKEGRIAAYLHLNISLSDYDI